MLGVGIACIVVSVIVLAAHLVSPYRLSILSVAPALFLVLHGIALLLVVDNVAYATTSAAVFKFVFLWTLTSSAALVLLSEPRRASEVRRSAAFVMTTFAFAVFATVADRTFLSSLVTPIVGTCVPVAAVLVRLRSAVPWVYPLALVVASILLGASHTVCSAESAYFWCAALLVHSASVLYQSVRAEQ